MLAIKLSVVLEAPYGNVQGIKEGLAMYLEQFGDVHLISISVQQVSTRRNEQIRLGGV